MFRFACLFVMAGVICSCFSTPAEKAAKHTKLGDAYVQKEKFPEAVIEYKNAVKAGPNDASLRWKLAKAALGSKDIRLAFQQLQKTVELDPNNFEAKGKLGEIYLLVGKSEEAARIADNLVVSWPKVPEGYVLKSGLSLRAGKIDEAISRMKMAVALASDKYIYMLAVGNFYLLKRDRKSASEWYDKALAASPNAPEVHVTRGNFYFASGEMEEGEKEYRKAIELSKDKEDLRILLAENYLYQGRMDDSEKELNSIIKEMDSQKARKNLAEIKLETGKIQEAKTIVGEILKKNDKDLDGKFLNGRIALFEKRFEDAKALFGEVIKNDAGMARAHLYNGLTDIQLGQIDLGKKEVQEAVRLDPGYVKARIVLGNLFLKSNEPAVAEKEAIEVLRRNPSNAQATVIYADSFLLRKEWRKAEQIYTAMIKQMPKNPIGYIKMGYSRKIQNKPPEAAAFFYEAMVRDPNDLAVVNEYIFSQVAARQTEKAKKTLDEYLSKEPKSAQIQEMAARLYLVMGKPADGEKALMKAIELSPEFTTPYYELGLLYIEQRRLTEAEDRFRKVLQKDAKNLGATMVLGVLLEAQGKIEEANKQYRRVLELAPKNPLAANNLATILSDYGGNLDEALKYAQIARETAVDDPGVADTLGWVYYRKGLYESAYPLISEAMKKAEKNPTVRFHHGMVLMKTGRNREGAAELEAALEMSPASRWAKEAKEALAKSK